VNKKPERMSSMMNSSNGLILSKMPPYTLLRQKRPELDKLLPSRTPNSRHSRMNTTSLRTSMTNSSNRIDLVHQHSLMLNTLECLKLSQHSLKVKPQLPCSKPREPNLLERTRLRSTATPYWPLEDSEQASPNLTLRRLAQN